MMHACSVSSAALAVILALAGCGADGHGSDDAAVGQPSTDRGEAGGAAADDASGAGDPSRWTEAGPDPLVLHPSAIIPESPLDSGQAADPRCAASAHDDGTGLCVVTGCAAGYHAGEDGTCLAPEACSAGTHNLGDGTCVLHVPCPPGQFGDRLGTCVPTAGVVWTKALLVALAPRGNIAATSAGSRCASCPTARSTTASTDS